MKAKIVWIDSDWFNIRDIETNKTYLGCSTEFDVTDLNKNDLVEYTLYTNLYMSQVDSIKKV